MQIERIAKKENSEGMDAVTLNRNSVLPSFQNTNKLPAILVPPRPSIKCFCKLSPLCGLYIAAAYQKNRNGLLHGLSASKNEVVVFLRMDLRTKLDVAGPSSQLKYDASSATKCCRPSLSGPFVSRAQGSDTITADRGPPVSGEGTVKHGEHRHSQASLCVDSEQGNLWARYEGHLHCLFGDVASLLTVISTDTTSFLSILFSTSGQIFQRGSHQLELLVSRDGISNWRFVSHGHGLGLAGLGLVQFWSSRCVGLCREAFEVNLADISLSSEETSGAIDIQATINGYGAASTSLLVLDHETITGGAFDFHGATSPLTIMPLLVTKKIVLVRHGLSAWNAEGRIQGSSDLSVLSVEGIAQAERCKQALANLKFSSCFASPISRAKTSAEVIWSGREEPLVFLDSLKEANLLFLEGMHNVDAKEQYPELFRKWREDPINFQVDGVYPVVRLWAQAKDAWEEILSAEGELILVVTHKSILRALICTALGMRPDRFRAMDINNGGISVFTVNTRGEPLLQCLNMTAHLHAEGVFY